MSSMYWSQKLSVGVLEMDHQHCQLLEMLGELHEAVRHGSTVEKLMPMARRLINHTVDHFRDEEAYMQAVGYPECDEHKQLHMKLIAEVEQRMSRVLGEDGGSAEELLAYLLAWVADHIQVDDMKYAEYARQHRMAETAQG